MGGYGVFAEFYDRLTTDVAYGPWADYLLSLFEKHGRGCPETLLDLACGSGSLSLELASRGVDVIGVDGSEDMLSLAMAKAARGNLELMFLEQDMRELDLFGTVSGAVCLLDSLEPHHQYRRLGRGVSVVWACLSSRGACWCSMPTPRISTGRFWETMPSCSRTRISCVSGAIALSAVPVRWRRRWISLRRKAACIERMTDVVRERAYSSSTWERLLKEADFELLAVYGERTEGAADGGLPALGAGGG